MVKALKFEIHYYLDDGSHSLDALVRNKCEADFLAIAYDIVRELDLPITIDAEALNEGGLRDLWKLLGDNNQRINTILLLLTTIFTYQLIPDSELTDLQKEESRLSIEKLKGDLRKMQPAPDVVRKGAVAFSQKAKIVVRKSEFYKKLAHTSKVQKVGYAILDENGKPIEPEKEVTRLDFINFILRTNKLPTEIIENATVEIVAPVLREGAAKWKGIYIDGLPISFEMNDEVFKTDVLSGSISFKSGDLIRCVLEIHKELSETGEIKITKYVVSTVLDKIAGGIRQETKSGKKYRRNKELDLRQQSLDFYEE